MLKVIEMHVKIENSGQKHLNITLSYTFYGRNN